MYSPAHTCSARAAMRIVHCRFTYRRVDTFVMYMFTPGGNPPSWGTRTRFTVYTDTTRRPRVYVGTVCTLWVLQLTIALSLNARHERCPCEACWGVFS